MNLTALWVVSREGVSLRKIKRITSGKFRWVYLGKDINLRLKVEQDLGMELQWILEGKLHEVAGDLRQPFLDFVENVGSEQTNKVSWWSTGFSWKAVPASDLFLLICYLKLSAQLIQEAKTKHETLVLVIEDPWLFCQLKENFSGNEEIAFVGANYLWLTKIKAFVYGVASRIYWALKILRFWFRAIRKWPTRVIKVPQTPTVALYSFPTERCLTNSGEWNDPFLPNLDKFLKELGYQVIRFFPPESGGMEYQLADRRECFRPILRYCTLFDFCRSFLAYWGLQGKAWKSIENLPVRFLVEREWWVEVRKPTLSLYHLYYRCLKNMLRKGFWGWIIYPYENQPWEKLTALCGSQLGIKTLGIQHSTISNFYISCFLGTNEHLFAPLPDVIWTSGSYPYEMLKQGSVPATRLRLWGSIRYQHLDEGKKAANTPNLGVAPLTEILIGLPLDKDLAFHLLHAIRYAFPDGGRKEGICFHVKSHPNYTIDLRELGFPAVNASSDLKTALRACGLIIFVGSTIGPEAIAMGRMVLRFIPELLINVDPSEVYGKTIPSCRDTTLREVVLEVIYGDMSSEYGNNIKETTSKIFSPVKWDFIREELRVKGRAFNTI